MAQVRYDISLLNTNESAITEIQRKLDLDKASYVKVAAGVDAVRIDEVLSGAKNNNINAVQTPSPPAPNVSQRLKLVAGTFFGILFAGIAGAFFIEIFADRTIRRPDEIETKLRIPLFLSIPKLGLNGHAKMLPFPVPAGEPGTPTIRCAATSMVCVTRRSRISAAIRTSQSSSALRVVAKIPV
jgi:hypothetical protein